jgi:hypothetical protein
MKHLPIVLLALLFAAPVMAATADVHYTLLHGAEAQRALHQCSRPNVAGVTGLWEPRKEAVQQLESDLPHLAQLASTTKHGLSESIGDPKSSRRQYIGVLIGGEHFIYINAWAADAFSQGEDAEWQKKAAVICDGGPSNWGALYDPLTGQFSELQGNGAA